MLNSNKKIAIKFFLTTFFMASGMLLSFNPVNATIADYCTKTAPSCTGADNMQVPIADGSVDPTSNNYGCPSEYPTYLGCVSGNIPCCGKYVAPVTGGSAGPASVSKSCKTGEANLYASSCTKQAECEAQTNAWKGATAADSGTSWSTNFLPDTACPSPTPGEIGCCMLIGTPAAPAAAGTTPARPPTEYKLTNPLGTTSIPVILGRIIRTFLGIVGALALAAFVYGGVMWMTARGDQSQVKKGQDALKSAVIGLFIIMFSYVLTGSFVKFWTAEQRDIAAEEGRQPVDDIGTPAGQDVVTARSAAEAEDKANELAEWEAEQAGVEAGVAPTPATKCSGLNEAQKQECLEGSVGTGWLEGQSTVNTSQPSGFGEPHGCEPGDLNCSTVGWKTVCNQSVFDTGYGTYNDLTCALYTDCQPGTVIASDCNALQNQLKDFINSVGANFSCDQIFVGGFGLQCGSQGACCKPLP